MESWSSRVVAEMIVFKREGRSFKVAWQLAVQMHPPRPMDLGLRGLRGTLEDDQALRSELDWFRAVCEDAWHDRRPALRHLSDAMDTAWIGDGSRTALHKTGGVRMRAA